MWFMLRLNNCHKRRGGGGGELTALECGRLSTNKIYFPVVAIVFSVRLGSLSNHFCDGNESGKKQ